MMMLFLILISSNSVSFLYMLAISMIFMLYFYNKKYLVMSLLWLEIFVMSVLFWYSLSFTGFSSMFLLVYLVMSVGEAVLGLSLLVYISRFKSTEMLKIG